jgi:hypothetical protein
MLNGLWWYENPKTPGVMWKEHFITDSYDTEGGATGDLNGDGNPDLVLAHYNHSGILWADFSGPEPKVHHVGGKEQDGHGIGMADVDGDGVQDMVAGFSAPGGGAIVIHRGNLDAFAPQSDASFQAIDEDITRV